MQDFLRIPRRTFYHKINNISTVEVDTSDKIYTGKAIEPNVKLMLLNT